MKLKGRHTAVFGLKGVGKSTWVQYMMGLPQFRHSHLVYDVCREHSGTLTTYVPRHRSGDEARAELDGAVERLVTQQERDMRPDVLVVEEVSRFCGPHSRPPPALYELIDLARHYDVGLVTVARRPAQVHSDLVDLADNSVYFRLTGKNDRRALDRTLDGLSDVVRNLPKYRFARVTGDMRVHVHDPVPEGDTTGEL
jgi:hypothetical protein